jgi:transketolase
MNYNPSNYKWANRDRFVLSNGHACALQYSMLHLAGYNVTLDDLKSFRQVGSKTPGHPENHITEGIEVATGPLGQGICNAVGLAIAERHLAGVYNKPGFDVVDHHTYVICGDGCLQEGVSGEASSLAGHLKLGKIVVLYDDNKITIDGETDLSFTEDVLKRYEAYGWHTQTVADGDSGNVDGLEAAINAAKAVTDKPSIIAVKTTIGYGSAKQGTEKVHGSPLGPEDLKNVKKAFGFDPEESFSVPDDVQSFYANLKAEGAKKEQAWGEMFAKYQAAHGDLAAQFERTMKGELPQGWADSLPQFTPESKSEGTRKYSQKVLGALVDSIPELIGGSADLTPSNNTKVKGNELDFTPDTPEGRYLRFGVREHAMAAICNGLAAHGGVLPFCATFLTFTGYALGAMRLSALSGWPVVYIYTHDSIGLGEDGPTHQPIETLAHIRSLPNFHLMRPADGNETSGAYKAAIQHSHTPVVLALSRQSCANLAGSSIDGVAKGAYVVQDADNAAVIITASGSEVALAVDAANGLKEAGVNARVVSFPCWELFEEQSQEYKDSVFTPGVPVLSVEASSVFGWERYSHAQVGMTTFGMSGPGGKVMEHFGFTKANVMDKAQKLLAFYSGKSAPALLSKPF